MSIYDRVPFEFNARGIRTFSNPDYEFEPNRIKNYGVKAYGYLYPARIDFNIAVSTPNIDLVQEALANHLLDVYYLFYSVKPELYYDGVRCDINILQKVG